MAIHQTILEHYQRDRAAAENGNARERVWRTYCLAMLETDANRKLGFLPWRRAIGDGDLPVRYAPYWRAIPANDLAELWKALERARHNPSAPDD